MILLYVKDKCNFSVQRRMTNVKSPIVIVSTFTYRTGIIVDGVAWMMYCCCMITDLNNYGGYIHI